MSRELKKYLNELAKKPLSGEDMLNNSGGNCKLIDYGEIKDYKSMKDLFGGKKKIICLFGLKNRDDGHWIAMINYPNCIEIYDPYSYKPDAWISFVPKNRRGSMGEDQAYLSKLLLKQDKPVVYQSKRFQKFTRGISTCGRWVSERLKHANMNIAEFTDMIMKLVRESGLSNDQLITLLTYKI